MDASCHSSRKLFDSPDGRAIITCVLAYLPRRKQDHVSTCTPEGFWGTEKCKSVNRLIRIMFVKLTTDVVCSEWCWLRSVLPSFVPMYVGLIGERHREKQHTWFRKMKSSDRCFWSEKAPLGVSFFCYSASARQWCFILDEIWAGRN